MFKVEGFSGPVQEKITFDYYVLMSIEFDVLEERIEQHVYWGIGKFLEIGVNPSSNVISSVTLLAASNRCYEKNIECADDCSQIIGLPLLKMNEEPNQGFKFCIEGDSVFIIFSENKIILKVVNNRVTFFFDENNCLCMIEVGGLSKEERSELEDGLAGKE